MSDQPDIVSELARLMSRNVGSASNIGDRAMAEIRRLRELVYDYPPTEFAPDGVTWKQTAEQLRADNAVLAAEVRAWRVLFSSASRGAGNWFKNRKEADQQMAKTDDSGALERDGGGR